MGHEFESQRAHQQIFYFIIWRLWHGASAYLSQYSRNMVRVQQTPLNSNINSIVGRSYSLGAVSL